MPRTDTYPPVGHVLRHLQMSLAFPDPDHLIGAMPIPEDLRDSGGALRLGALATLIDVAAGTFCHELVRPDWLATTDMKIHRIRPTFDDQVQTVTRTIRQGRRAILSETVASDEAGPVAKAWVTYARLPRRDDTPYVAGASRIGTTLRYAEPGASDRRPSLEDYIGAVVRHSGDDLVLDVELHPRIRNSFGSIQGGVAASLVEQHAVLTGETVLGQPCRVRDLHLSYLGQTRTGPLEVTGALLASEGDFVTSEIAIRDGGTDGHLLDLGTATVEVSGDLRS